MIIFIHSRYTQYSGFWPFEGQMVVNSYLNFVAGFAVVLQLQSGVPGAGIFYTLEFVKGNMFYFSNFICQKGFLFCLMGYSTP